MTDLRTAAQQALEALEFFRDTAICSADTEAASEAITALRAALAQQAEPALQTCNCRWDGDVQVQQCTLHEAHVDAIHEWAERAKVAERKLAQQAEARLAVAAERQRLGPPPERTAVDRLMKRCQIGVGPRQMGEAHDIMAECYGTLGRQQIEIEQLRAALLDARDCRTCRNFTTRSGGCVSVLRCVDGSGYKRQGRFQYWESAPVEPAPF